MADDVVLNKSAIIERCLSRVKEEYEGHQDELETNFTRQDALVLNLLRACEAAIDLAMHVVRVDGLGMPQSSRHAFELLEEAGIIQPDTAQRMKRMVGFRNVAIHHYRDLDMAIVRSIVDTRLDDFRQFISVFIKRSHGKG